MRKLIFIKLGGSLITDKTKPFTLRPLVLKRIAQELAQAQKQSHNNFVIVNGAGSYGHLVSIKYKTMEKKVNHDFTGFVFGQQVGAQVNRIVVDQLIEVGLRAIFLSPSNFMITHQGKLEQIYLSPLKRALAAGLIPVTYGDVIMDRESGFSDFSSELVLNFLAKRLKTEGYQIEKVIYVGTTNGVYDQKQATISQITPQNYPCFKKCISGVEGFDVTGGMRHKVVEALRLAKKGIPSLIINGLISGNLKKAILGQKITSTWVVGYNSPNGKGKNGSDY